MSVHKEIRISQGDARNLCLSKHFTDEGKPFISITLRSDSNITGNQFAFMTLDDEDLEEFKSFVTNL